MQNYCVELFDNDGLGIGVYLWRVENVQEAIDRSKEKAVINKEVNEESDITDFRVWEMKAVA